MPSDADAASRKAKAKAPQCPSIGTRSVVFSKAIDGSTFATGDGTQIRLAGILPPGSGGETLSSGQSQTARTLLEAALRQGQVTLAEQGKDRYGRVLAQVFSGGVWVQDTLLKQGALRVSTDAGSAVCAIPLLKAESEARTAQSGHWRDGLFAVRTPDHLRSHIGSFQIVEGTVVTASQMKGRAYINFGPDYRTDFTVTVAPGDMKAFRQAKFDAKKFAGKRVRVRGWVELYNGPEMEIATPSALETLN